MAGRLGEAPSLAGGAWRVVGRPQHTVEVGQLAEELLLGEDVVAGRDHVRPIPAQLAHQLCGQAEPARGVLTVDDRQMWPVLFLDHGQDRLDRLAARLPDHVGHEQDPQLLVSHRSIVVETRKGAPKRDSLLKSIWRTPLPSSRARR